MARDWFSLSRKDHALHFLSDGRMVMNDYADDEISWEQGESKAWPAAVKDPVLVSCPLLLPELDAHTGILLTLPHCWQELCSLTLSSALWIAGLARMNRFVNLKFQATFIGKHPTTAWSGLPLSLPSAIYISTDMHRTTRVSGSFSVLEWGPRL